MANVDMVGFMGSKYMLGAWSAIALPFIFLVSPFLCVFLIPMFYFSQSSTAVAAGVVSFLLMVWFKNRRLAYFMGAFLLIAGTWYVLYRDMPTGQFSKRFQVWWAAINLLRGDFYFGAGIGTWKVMNVMTTQETSLELKHWSWMHNDYLQVLFECGAVGLLILLRYLKRFFVLFQNRLVSFDKELQCSLAAFMAVLIIAFFHFPFHCGRLAGISLFVFACLEAKLQDIQDAAPKREVFENETLTSSAY